MNNKLKSIIFLIFGILIMILGFDNISKNPLLGIITIIISVILFHISSKVNNNSKNRNNIITEKNEAIPNTDINKKLLFDEYQDPLYNEIVDFAIEFGKISASLIQRKYRIGYNRAAQLIDKLEENKIIGPQDGQKPRDVLVKNLSDIEPTKKDVYNIITDIENLDYLLYQIDYKLSGNEFEQFSKKLLINNGFEKVVVTKSSNDYGADIIAIKDSIKYAIQCKKYNKKVGIEAVQEILGSKSLYNCHVGVVLTNNTFTDNARKLAMNNNILLWDRHKLIEMIKFQKNIKENK